MIGRGKFLEILRILELSPKVRYEWFEDNFELEGYHDTSVGSWVPTESMCDVAFRMRDEVQREDPDRWSAGCAYVTNWCMNRVIEGLSVTNIQKRINAEQYVLSRSAIYWMVAIYIAKLLKG